MQYPTSRPQFFMNAFVKTLRDNQVSMQFGDDAYRLLIAVVCREDDTGYKRAVVFHNIPLMHEAGIKSEDSLSRARRKLVEAGWLVYVAGAKRGPGTYFVCVPDDAIVTTKQQMQPVKQEVVTESVPDSCGELAGQVLVMSGDSCGLSAGYERVQTGDSCGQVAEPSSHSHSQREEVRQSPSETGAAPLAPPTPSLFDDGLSNETSTKKPAKAKVVKAKKVKPEPPENYTPAVAGFFERWNAKYGTKYDFKDVDGSLIKQMLKLVDGDLTRILAVFDAFFADTDEWYVGDGCTIPKMKQHFNHYQAKLASPETVPKTSKFPTREQVKSDRWLSHAMTAVVDENHDLPDQSQPPLALH